jgi:protein TonB
MLNAMLTPPRRTRFRAPFLGSVLSHAAGILVLFRLASPQPAPPTHQRSLMVYLAPATSISEAQRRAVRAPRLFRPESSTTILRPPDVPTPPPFAAIPPKIAELPQLPAAPVPIERPHMGSSPASAQIVAFTAANAPEPKQQRTDRVVQHGSFAAPATANRTGGSEARLRVGAFSDHLQGAVTSANGGAVAAAGFDPPAPKRAMEEHPAVASSGGRFGTAVTAAARSDAQAAVSVSHFEAMAAKPTRLQPSRVTSDDHATPLEILNKPKPAYSAEARSLQIEGEVLLEALFTAGGQLRVLKVLRSLGHGLDENAIHAAMGIRFRPAVERGQPVDTVATVHIEFQLAF